jgi:4-amino-4-deoxy-L-arabinose transferase-like glycosyltransferase
VTAFNDELRLAAILALSAFVIRVRTGVVAPARRDDPIQALLDAFLLTYLVQYVAVGLPGMLGVLNFGAIAAVALAASGAMWFIRGSDLPTPKLDARAWWVLGACMLFVIGEVAGMVYGQAYLPPLANDALTYHLPAAVSWLQSGRIDLYQTWFFNPANTYSPLGGSIFITWLLAPIGNDALARFTQAPVLLFIFVGMVQLCRALGANILAAALIAAGAVLSRPFVSQAILAKDDLFVAAFFLAALVGLARARAGARDPLVPWRIGIALGLLFSIKYTVWLSAPLLVLLIDAPVRARWRAARWTIAIVSAAAIASPWYLRNVLLTSNPLYPTDLPFLSGMFTTRRSDELASLSGLWKTFVTGYYSTTVVLALPLLAAWIAACCLRGGYCRGAACSRLPTRTAAGNSDLRSGFVLRAKCDSFIRVCCCCSDASRLLRAIEIGASQRRRSSRPRASEPGSSRSCSRAYCRWRWGSC